MEKLKLLLADDDKKQQILFKRGFEICKSEEQFDLTTASNGKEAVDAYIEIKPDIVILDLMMPVSNGFDALEKIREIDNISGSSSVIIILTALEEKYYKEKAISLGADDFITKPIILTEIGDKIYSIYKGKNP